MTKIHKIEDAARLAMAGCSDLNPPQLRTTASQPARLQWVLSAIAFASGVWVLWMMV